MSYTPVTLNHPSTGNSYIANSRLEFEEAVRNGWKLPGSDKTVAKVSKTPVKAKVISDVTKSE